MRLEHALENYYFHSGKVSDIVRQMALAGVAVVWIFRTEQNGENPVPHSLAVAALWLIATLALDFAQYVSATIVWGWFHRRMEKTHKEEDEVVAPKESNWPALTFFSLKIVTVLVAYARLLMFLAEKVSLV